MRPHAKPDRGPFNAYTTPTASRALVGVGMDLVRTWSGGDLVGCGWYATLVVGCDW
ncbi:MAG: hypothetical protein WD491_14860 [Balneolales bacterium]